MKYVVANWKQHNTLNKAAAWSKDFLTKAKRWIFPWLQSIVCPPTPFLEKMGSVLGAKIKLGVQDISQFEDGAHTGFVGAAQVAQFCRYAIVGHSERQEAQDLVLQKARVCLKSGLVPIVCFKSSQDYQIVDGAIYALEDPENISVGGQYRPKRLEEVVKFLSEARKFFGSEATIIYGGSVNAENASELSSIDGLDGVLVGNASLNPHGFADIVRKFSL